MHNNLHLFQGFDPNPAKNYQSSEHKQQQTVHRFKVKTQSLTQIQSLRYNPLNTLIKYNPPTCTLLQHTQAKHELNFHKQTSSPHRSKKWFVCYIPADFNINKMDSIQQKLIGVNHRTYVAFPINLLVGFQSPKHVDES